MDRADELKSIDAAANRRLLPYERPQILSRQALEAVASVCAPGPPPAGPAKGNPVQCPQGPISS